MDASFHLVAFDRGAEAILNDFYTHDGSHTGDLPTPILSLLHERSRSELDAVCALVRAGSHEYNCRVFVVNPQNGHQSVPMFAVHLKREVSVMDAVHLVGLDYHLTDREQEVLRGIAMGLTNKQLAQQLNITPNTVKTFLRLVMVKMGVARRSGVVVKLLEHT